jgi:hypothetical protein
MANFSASTVGPSRSGPRVGARKGAAGGSRVAKAAPAIGRSLGESKAVISPNGGPVCFRVSKNKPIYIPAVALTACPIAQDAPAIVTCPVLSFKTYLAPSLRVVFTHLPPLISIYTRYYLIYPTNLNT